MRENLRRIAKFLAGAHIIFYAFPWLMFLVVMGTVTQKDLGLYAANEKYFSSLILWLGPIPTPGGLATIGLIFVALTIKFLFYSPWKWERAGTIVSHFGIWLLLLGGIITAATTQEGFLIIAEGEKKETIADYFDRELIIKEPQARKRATAYNFASLQKGDVISAGETTIKILEKCDNCGVRAPSGQYDKLQGLAVNMELYPVKSEKQPEANFSGLVIGANTGTYIVMEDLPINPDIQDIKFSITRTQTPLPFAVTLKDFRKIDYPGTAKAQQYESDLILHDGDIIWPETISMNKPLRYKGYTLYQSSFDQSAGVEVSVLNIVKNQGRAFPYISSLIITLGLLLHLILRLQQQTGQKRKAKK